MKDQRPLSTARRKAQQKERELLGIAGTPCLLCVEDHHVLGRKADPQFTGPLCQMHHREVHEAMRKAGVSLLEEPNPIARVASALRALAVFQESQAKAIDRLATHLSDHLEKNNEQSEK